MEQHQQEIKNFSFFPKSIYKWIKTEQAGLTETLVEIKNGFAVFKSGRRCSLGTLQEMMDPVSEGPDNTAEVEMLNNRLTAGLPVEEAIAKIPEDLPILKNEFSDAFVKPEIQKPVVTQPKSQPIQNIPTISKPEKSPSRLLLEGNKSIEKINVELSIPIDIPNKEIFNLLISSFPDNDVFNEVIELVLSKIDKEKTVEILSGLIKKTITDKYNQH